MPALHDSHVHLGFAVDPRAVARNAARAGSLLFCQTVEPAEYARLASGLGDCPNVRLGAGLHPWWVQSGESAAGQLAPLLDALEGTRFVGEVGLDFSPRHQGTRAEQVQVLEAVLSACARRGDAVVSVHCVQAADVLCDLLERTGAARECAVVLHWFSGTSDQLTRARRLGCWFSAGPRMLASKRGQAYARAAGEQRLLLETDFPAGDPADMPAELDFAHLEAELARGQELLDQALGRPCGEQIAQNALGLLGSVG
ncbi:MAG: TatD family hydrolase [Coriobacteriia bacterium]|nr:TatD family hydrolase [Coriobacteriia bacterium]